MPTVRRLTPGYHRGRSFGYGFRRHPDPTDRRSWQHPPSCGWYERRQRWLRERCGPEPAGTFVLILDEEERAQFRAEAERRRVPWRPQPREDRAWRICVDPELPFGSPIHSQDLIMLAKKAATLLMRR